MQQDQTLTDLTFFTNEGEVSLSKRFAKLLVGVRKFDALVGYFFASGFHELSEALSDVEKVRILVGLRAGSRIANTLSVLREERRHGFGPGNGFGSVGAQGRLDLVPDSDVRLAVKERIEEEAAASEDTREVEQGMRRFAQMIRSGQMEVRAHREQNLHAKVYIMRYPVEDRDYGRIITGSSNFSKSGLVAQNEFNVELKQPVDVRFAEEKFESLWANSVEVSEAYAQALEERTWIKKGISPYHLYLRFLWEHFKDDIAAEEELAPPEEDDSRGHLPEGFMDLKYQRQAVAQALRILEEHNGVFISDVVGLGKTYVTARLAGQIENGYFLVLAPPSLTEYWKQTFNDFGISRFRVESAGKLHHVQARGHERYTHVIVDEAHGFRNETTQSYEQLHDICFGKKVVLVSATPINNDVSDIASLLKLFQIPRRSTIPGHRDLTKLFRRIAARKRKEEPGTKSYEKVVREESARVREEVLAHVMVRRTRSEIVKYYSDDMERQGLSFPTVEKPRQILYEIEGKAGEALEETVRTLQDFAYSRYTPLNYLKDPSDAPDGFESWQTNIQGFMRSLLVKRLESSFYAFENTVEYIRRSYEQFLQTYREGKVYIGEDLGTVRDLIESGRSAQLEEAAEKEEITVFEADQFTDEFEKVLLEDLSDLKRIEQEWERIQSDPNIEDEPKLRRFAEALKEEDQLSDKLLIFTEAEDTAELLYDTLSELYPDEVYFYSGAGGIGPSGRASPAYARRTIKGSFEPGSPHRDTGLRILITTDALSQGINLHRAAVVVNYDLPWNPTKVMQRVGRVNRVGTEHKNVWVYNIFPAEKPEKHLGYKDKIAGKIEMFRSIIGADTRYLTEGDEEAAHELFEREGKGAAALVEKLSERPVADEDEEEQIPSEQRHLLVLRRALENEPEAVERAKTLPAKSRMAAPPKDGTEGLLAYFRKGKLERFYLASEENESPRELTFLDAADLFEAEPSDSSGKLPDDYYDRLARAKDNFEREEAGNGFVEPMEGGSTNEEQVRNRLRANNIRFFENFDEGERRVLEATQEALRLGSLPDMTTKKLRQRLGGVFEPKKVVEVLKDTVAESVIEKIADEVWEGENAPARVILSKYLLPSK